MLVILLYDVCVKKIGVAGTGISSESGPCG